MASLTVSADYERKFKTRLVTRYVSYLVVQTCDGYTDLCCFRLIYPQNSSGEPVINPNGKYFVSFNLNGCRRRVSLFRGEFQFD